MQPSNSDSGNFVGRIIAFVLWALLVTAIGAVAIMTWHPWVSPWTGIPR